MKEIKGKIKQNANYLLAVLFISGTLLVNFAKPAVTSQDHHDAAHKTAYNNNLISDDNPVYFDNNVFNSQSGEYYRLIFRQQADEDTEISVKITTALDDEYKIKDLNLKKSSHDSFVEILFPTNGQYTDVAFEKNNKKDGAVVSISNVQVSKLNIADDQELSKLKPTIFGEVDFNASDQQQISQSDAKFNQLNSKGIILGQIFQSQVNYLSGVAFYIDKVAKDNNDAKYSLELRTADFDGSSAEISKPIATVNLHSGDLEKYKQQDGKVNIPIFSQLEVGRYYFIGFNNAKIKNVTDNYLVLHGTTDKEQYPHGIIAVKNAGNTFTVDGSLYFETYGEKFKKINNTRILSNTIIEDLGKGNGVYNYQITGNNSDLIDLYSYSEDIAVNSEKKAIYGDVVNGSNFVYKFDTLYPFSQVRISGQREDKWSGISVSYSFNGRDWSKMTPLSDQSLKMEYTIYSDGISRNQIYIKCEPKANKSLDSNDNATSKQYGLENFMVKAKLLNK